MNHDHEIDWDDDRRADMLADAREAEQDAKRAELGEDYEPGICPTCSGSGEGMHDGSTCRTCHGKGES